MSVSPAKRHVAVPVTPVAVHSIDGRDYLLVEKLDERTMQIRRIKDAVVMINPYWRVWAQTILGQVNVRRDLHIEITVKQSTVRVSSRRPIKEWYWIVREALTAIRLLPCPPMVRVIDHHGMTHVVVWRFIAEHTALRQFVSNLSLPAKAWVNFRLEPTTDYDGLRLVRRSRGEYEGEMRQREVRQLIELKIALHYAETLKIMAQSTLVDA